MSVDNVDQAMQMMEDCAFRNDESGVIALFKLLCMGHDQPLDVLPFFNPRQDTVVFEMKFAYGRADIVIFHADGTATVIEAKDGKNGYTGIVAGIGQASLYAAQLASLRAVKSVRRALMWSFRKPADAEVICQACDVAGVIPIPFWMPMSRLLAATTLLPIYKDREARELRAQGEQAC
jgi:hypothetical protein